MLLVGGCLGFSFFFFFKPGAPAIDDGSGSGLFYGGSNPRVCCIVVHQWGYCIASPCRTRVATDADQHCHRPVCRHGNDEAAVLAKTLDEATTKYLLNNKTPSRKVNELDNRGSHYYVALYWAQALADQTSNPMLASHFAAVAKELAANEDTIVAELIACQGGPANLGGYFRPDTALATAAMRPSTTLNAIVDSI